MIFIKGDAKRRIIVTVVKGGLRLRKGVGEHGNPALFPADAKQGGQCKIGANGGVNLCAKVGKRFLVIAFRLGTHHQKQGILVRRQYIVAGKITRAYSRDNIQKLAGDKLKIIIHRLAEKNLLRLHLQ